MLFSKYVKANSLDEAYELCKKRTNVVLGGMMWLKMQNKEAVTAIDLSGLGLDKIEETNDEFIMGTMVSLRAFETHEGLDEFSQGSIREAMKYIVGVQFRNTATVGGSVFGRYGFSDVLTILMALDAEVELYNRGRMKITDFAYKFNEKDILTHIIIPKTTRKTIYLSVRNTKTDFPVLTCAISEKLGKYNVVIGARPLRAIKYEKNLALLEAGITEEIALRFSKEVAKNIEVGSNLRASEEYRRKITEVLVYRSLMQLGGKQWN